jgi:transcriptional regulator with XRE-family HTH domain
MRPPYSGLRRGNPNPIVCGRRFCAICGRFRHACDFRPDPANATSGLRSYCRICDARRKRARYARRTAEEKRLRREYDRFWAEARRRREGAAVRLRHRRVPKGKDEIITVVPGPLLAEASRHILLQQWDDPEYDWSTLARTAGISDRTLRRLRNGEQERIGVDIADRVAVAIGVPLALIYPYEEAVAA